MKIWESKTSIDYEDINMNLVKKVINCIAKPITYYATYLSALEYSREKKLQKLPKFLSLGISIRALTINLFHCYHNSL